VTAPTDTGLPPPGVSPAGRSSWRSIRGLQPRRRLGTAATGHRHRPQPAAAV